MLNAGKLLGKIENGVANTTEKRLLRIMTPVMKLFTAKEAVSFISEGLECFGAMGYMENSSIPVYLRDAQVLPIWEGTTNVLSLDLVRALQRDKECISALAQEVRIAVDQLSSASGNDS